MAEEPKKKPDLKARLNRTVATPNPLPSTPTPEPPAPGGVPAPGLVMQAPLVSAPSPVFSDPLAPAGLAGDIAPPEFIRQQMEQRAAEEARLAAEARARVEAEARAEARAAALAAAAADPFSSGVLSAGPQEVRLVIDDKAVSDAEVGRKNTGLYAAIAGVGVLMLGVGYLLGGFMESKDQGRRTLSAIEEVRTAVNAASATVLMMKEKVDRAALAAGIQPQQSEDQPQQPQAQARVDTDLGEWFLAQPGDPPLSPDTYAGKVGRMRPDLVARLMKVQLGLQQAWRDLRRHAEATQSRAAVINASLIDAQRARGEFNRMLVVFARGAQNGPPVMGTLVLGTAIEGTPGAYTIAPAVVGTPPTRTLFSAGDLTTQLTTAGIPVSATAGQAALVVQHLSRPWVEYTARLRSLQALVTELANDQRGLNDALNGQGGGG
jgi:hypothetical protein